MFQRRSSSQSPSTLERLGSSEAASDMKSLPSNGMASLPSGAAGGGGGDDGADSIASKSLAALSDSLDKSGGGGMNTFKIVLLVLMVLQNSATVLVGRHTRSSVAKEHLYSVNHLIVVVELGKLILSAALELHATRFRLVESIRLHNLQRPLDAAKIVVPALLYLVQNTLLYVALSNLTAPIFQVTYQCKLVTTALVSVIMLQRSYSMQQWICLVVLSVGVAVVVLDNDSKNSSSTSKTEQSLFVGLVAVSIACMSSALAGVYFEKVLKKPEKEVATPASLWMRNMQLAFFSVVIALGQGVYEGNKDDLNKPYLHGFTFWVWVLVALQAGGGLLVAAVIKVCLCCC
jgi:solute carrier family 35 (UDP-sugar transporter), member A1/2/3